MTEFAEESQVSDYRAAVCSFVPTVIRERALLGPDTLNAAGSKEHVAGVLFADISGFTALTETLSKRGDEGAEELTRLRAYLDHQLQGLQGAVSKLANKLQ